MKSTSAINTIVVAALLGFASSASAQTLGYGPSDHGAQAGKQLRHHDAVRTLEAVDALSDRAASALKPDEQHATYDAGCRAHDAMLSSGYDHCVQNLRASAMTGGGGYK
jgi:hypothetical protein